MLSFSLFTFHFDLLNSSDEIFTGIMRDAGEVDQEEAVLLISMIACFGEGRGFQLDTSTFPNQDNCHNVVLKGQSCSLT